MFNPRDAIPRILLKPPRRDPNNPPPPLPAADVVLFSTVATVFAAVATVLAAWTDCNSASSGCNPRSSPESWRTVSSRRSVVRIVDLGIGFRFQQNERIHQAGRPFEQPAIDRRRLQHSSGGIRPHQC